LIERREKKNERVFIIDTKIEMILRLRERIGDINKGEENNSTIYPCATSSFLR
jgi:hypothetical protein